MTWIAAVPAWAWLTAWIVGMLGVAVWLFCASRVSNDKPRPMNMAESKCEDDDLANALAQDYDALVRKHCRPMPAAQPVPTLADVHGDRHAAPPDDWVPQERVTQLAGGVPWKRARAADTEGGL